MKTIAAIILLVCAGLTGFAQTNFVRNPSFEEYSKCPDQYDQITYCLFWTNVIDTIYRPMGNLQSEFYNKCASGNIYTDIPSNSNFYQFPHYGNGMAGAAFYFDKSPSPTPPTPDYREYLQGRLLSKLSFGKSYCFTIFVNLMESSGYAINKIAAYLDDGSINSLSISAGKEITSIIPQVSTNLVLQDTLNWIKLQGSFIATGSESHITIGVFVPNDSIDRVVTDYFHIYTQYSYYLIDDVSVIPLDLPAKAGPDAFVEVGKAVQIGSVGDTTAEGLDCKWYHKGLLIDSGAIISVNGGTSVGTIDTYLVVQTICGLVKTDSVTVTTVPVGIKEYDTKGFSIYPNPSNGKITLTSLRGTKQSVTAIVYDFLARVVYQKEMTFTNNKAVIDLNAADGIYILELKDDDGNANAYRQRIEIRD